MIARKSQKKNWADKNKEEEGKFDETGSFEPLFYIT